MFTNYVLLFFIYALLGWVLEVSVALIKEKKFINRGYLMGPVVPIYAVGGLLITIFLKKYYDDILVLFIMSTIICTTLEYVISYIMEKIFNLRWWDYSDRKFNLNGRVCLGNAIPFGILGTLIVKFINPILFKFMDSIPDIIATILVIILSSFFIADIIISTKITYNIKNISKNIKHDSTEEITKRVRAAIKKNIKPYKRVLKAFPNMHKIDKKR